MKADYYPFGMEMPGRTYNAGNYRYGYTGKEQDPELKGNGNSYDFGNRQYDPRLGRWMITDPMKEMYPNMSPYCYAGNMPIAAKDPDGNLIIFVNGYRFGAVPGGYDDLPAGEKYWTEYQQYDRNTSTWVSNPNAFFDAAKTYFHDDAMAFMDGTGADGSSTATQRFVQGRLDAVAMMDLYRGKLADNETIEFLTHSMGAAYAEGVISAMMEDEYFKDKVSKVVHLSACDSENVPIAPNAANIERVQLALTGDKTLDKWGDPTSGQQRIKGVQTFGYVKYDYRKFYPERTKVSTDHDSHMDTKSNPYIFNVLLDLESQEMNYISTRYIDACRSNKIYFSFLGSTKVHFKSLFIDGKYLESLGKYSSRSDKFIGPEINECDDECTE